MRLGISSGSLDVLKRKYIKEDSPTTLYLMTLQKCLNNCAFCTQAKESHADALMLSRISWPPIEIEDLINLLKEYNPFKRLCFQVTNHLNWEKELINTIKLFEKFNLPISISAPFDNISHMEKFFELGVDRINISIDAVGKDLFKKIKNGDFEERLAFIKEASTKFPSQITSHIIVGLGENERELVYIIDNLSKWEVTVALFAYTPLKGTLLKNMNPPNYYKYRKIQLITFLLQKNLISFNELSFDGNDNLLITENILSIAEPFFEIIFKTTGCPNCNRPYYNESPRIVPYNFPRKLKDREIEEIKDLLRNGRERINL